MLFDFLLKRKVLAYQVFLAKLVTNRDGGTVSRQGCATFCYRNLIEQYYDNALDHEESIIRVIINPSTPLYTGAQIRYIDSNRTLTDNGDFIFITINFTVLNHIPLT